MSAAPENDWYDVEGAWDDEDFDEDNFCEPDQSCSQWLDSGRFVCGAVGSEDCDGCPNYKYLGLTPREAEILDGIDPRSDGDE